MSHASGDGNQHRFDSLLRIVASYFDPEIGPTAIEHLREITRLPADQQSATVREFVRELRALILGQADGLPPGALAALARYPEEDDRAFARRVWIELFPRDPLPGAPSRRFEALLTLAGGYYDPHTRYAHVDDLQRVVTRPVDEQGAYARQFKDELRAVIRDTSDELPRHALWYATGYQDADDQAFAWRVWRDLYPDEPVSTGDDG